MWQKISWLRPCKSGANLSGPTLPRAMLRFWCARNISFFKTEGSCVQLPYMHTGLRSHLWDFEGKAK